MKIVLAGSSAGSLADHLNRWQKHPNEGANDCNDD
jgi:hypothetical protein